MGRKKIDKNSLEYMVSKLLFKEDIIGFQFTSGNTPLGVKENRPLNMSCSINESTQNNVVIDSLKYRVQEKIEETIFGKNHTVTPEKIKHYQQQFKDLGYEVEEAEIMGVWYWFRVHCKADDIVKHVNRIKENLII